jgi:8-oxo-dGTP pyrophosphatase MutT (NUDIX family)
VVSCLIFPPPATTTSTPSSLTDRVLLFRRSNKVRTYQNKLGPIAGSVESRPKRRSTTTSASSQTRGRQVDEGAIIDRESPIDAAWRELNEEIGLGPQDLEFLRAGKSFTFSDSSAIAEDKATEVNGRKGRLWTVYPFAFRLRRGLANLSDEDSGEPTLKMNLNFEHSSYEWFPIQDILAGKLKDDCVPRLDETLRRLYISSSSVLSSGLQTLQTDHEHGARELGTMAVQTLVEVVERQLQESGEVGVTEVEAWWKNLRMQAWHLVNNGRPSMGTAIGGAVVRALGSVRRDVLVGGWGVRGKVAQGLRRAGEERKEVAGRVGERFAEVLGGWFDGSMATTGSTELGSPGGPLLTNAVAKRNDSEGEGERWVKILTLSSSSTIKGAILRALEDDETRRIELRILESRPLFEGVSMARSLVGLVGQSNAPARRLKIVLASDASVGVLAKDVDVVLIGADRISEHGDVSNKTGSLAAVLTAKSVTRGKAVVVVVSELEKIAGPGDVEEHAVEDNDPSEVMGTWGDDAKGAEGLWKEMVTVRNVYFEWVMARDVDCYVCETGFLTREDIGRYSRRVKELEGEMFGDL